jgi:DNA-binding MarR family transcriptional regulator
LQKQRLLAIIKIMTAELDESRNTAWRAFLTTHATVIELIERELAEAGLPPLSWYDILFALYEAPNHCLRMHELARAVLLTRSQITRLVDRLEAAGLLYRQPCPTDRRGASAAITAEGLATRQKMWPVYAQGISKYFGRHLSDAEVNVVIEAFRRVQTAACEAEESD